MPLLTSEDCGSSILSRHAAQTLAQRQAQGRAQNACGRCGATAYKSLMARDETGVMRADGRYQCVQCHLVFTEVRQWRERDNISTAGH